MSTRRSRRKIQPYVLVETAEKLDEFAFAEGLSVGQIIDRVVLATAQAIAPPPEKSKRPMLTSAPEHVCTAWRLNALNTNVCVDENCQKPKNRRAT